MTYGTVKTKDKPIWHVRHGSTRGLYRSTKLRKRNPHGQYKGAEIKRVLEIAALQRK